MQVRINRKKYNVFAFDIETHNDEESIKNQTTSMWLGCLIDETHKIDDEENLYAVKQLTEEEIREIYDNGVDMFCNFELYV